jgi:D-lactate dehydrogenase
MCCGVDQNAYHAFASMRFMLLSGSVIDAAESDAAEKFHALEPEPARILELKAHIESNPRLSERAYLQFTSDLSERISYRCSKIASESTSGCPFLCLLASVPLW